MSGQFLRIKKLTGKGIVEVAARHNHREIMAELGASHIDPERIALNRVLRGHSTAAAVATEAKTRMSEAGVKALRRTAVMALEIIFSLPPDTSVDCDRFFDDAVQWAERHFNVPVISAIVHKDEAAPHCHVLLLPLVDGRMVGSDLMGGRAKLLALHSAFHAHVGERHGLKRQASLQKGYSLGARREAARIALDVLQANGELCGTSDAVMDELRDLIAANPAKLLSLMGRTMPTEQAKAKDTFVGIMTRPCKPEPKPVGMHKSHPIGKAKDGPIGTMDRNDPIGKALPGTVGMDRDDVTQPRKNYQTGIARSGAGAADLSLSCVGKRIPLTVTPLHTNTLVTQPFKAQPIKTRPAPEEGDYAQRQPRPRLAGTG